MKKSSTSLDQTIQNQLGLWLAVILVGITGYLVGSQHPASVSQEQSSPSADTTSSIIDSIQASAEQEQTTTIPSTSAPAISKDTSTPTAIININTASATELDTLPGIGPAYAKAIIDYRSTHGPFIRPEDIQQVKGIGPKTYEKLKDKITI